MQWGSWLLHSSETTAVATPIAQHFIQLLLMPRMQVANSFSLTLPQLQSSLGSLCTVAARILDLQDPELPLHSNAPTLLQCLCTGSHCSHHTRPPFYPGGNECGGAGFLHQAAAVLWQSLDHPLSAALDAPEPLPYKEHFVCGSHSCPVYIERN